MKISAYVHGPYNELVDVLVTIEGQTVRLSGERGRRVRELAEDAVGVDLLDEDLTITSPDVLEQIGREVAEHLAER